MIKSLIKWEFVIKLVQYCATTLVYDWNWNYYEQQGCQQNRDKRASNALSLSIKEDSSYTKSALLTEGKLLNSYLITTWEFEIKQRNQYWLAYIPHAWTLDELAFTWGKYTSLPIAPPYAYSCTNQTNNLKHNWRCLEDVYPVVNI